MEISDLFGKRSVPQEAQQQLPPAPPPACDYSYIKNKKLRAAIIDADARLDNLPVIGWQLRAAFNGLNCIEFINPKQTSAAQHASYYDKGKHLEAIDYSPASLKNLRDFCVIRSHEMVHVLQCARVAAMHARIDNTATPFVLSPRSRAHLTWLIEVDALFRQSIIAMLNGLRDAGAEISPEMARGIQGFAPVANIRDDLRARNACFLNKDNPELQEVYIGHNLDVFEKFAASGAYRSRTFVRLDEQDIMQLALHLPGSPLLDRNGKLDPYFTRMNFSAANEERLRGLEKKFGAEDEHPALSVALAARGSTPLDFIENICRDARYRPPASYPWTMGPG